MVSSLERERVAEALPEAELHDVRDLGFYELLDGELSRDAVALELASRAAAAMGVSEALVDPDFPVGVADRLRADGIAPDPGRRGVRRSPTGQVASRARGHPPRPARGRGRDGGRRGDSRRRPRPTATRSGSTAAADRRGGARRDPRGLRGRGRPGAARRSSSPRSGRATATSRARGRCRRGCRSRSTSGRATRPRAAGPT